MSGRSRRFWAMVVLGAMVLGGRTAAASPWTLTGGVEGQSGERIFKAVDCDFVWAFGVRRPPIRYSLAAAGERFRVSGHYEAGETADVTIDPDFTKDHTKYLGDAYGRSVAWGCDVAGRWTFGKLEVEPQAGYRYALFAPGARQETVDPRDQRTHTYAFGLETRGARVGLGTVVHPTDRLSLSVTAGWLPCVTVNEVRIELAEGASTDGGADTVNRRWPAKQESQISEAALRVEYRLASFLTASAGYDREWGKFRFDPGTAAPGAGCLGELYRYSGERWSAGLKASF